VLLACSLVADQCGLGFDQRSFLEGLEEQPPNQNSISRVTRVNSATPGCDGLITCTSWEGCACLTSITADGSTAGRRSELSRLEQLPHRLLHFHMFLEGCAACFPAWWQTSML
jgi:hypothetical protein